MNVFAIGLVIGALVHLVGAVMALRAGETGKLPATVAGVGAAAAAGAAAVVLASGGTSPDSALGATIGLGAALAMLSGHGFRSAHGWPSFAISLAGAGLAVLGAWQLSTPDRVHFAMAGSADAWSAAAGACFLGGLGFVVLSLLVATRDSRIGRWAWLGLGAACSLAVGAALSGASRSLGDGVFWPLVDGDGVPVEVIGEVARGADQVQLLAAPAVATGDAGLLATLCVSLVFAVLAASLASALGAKLGRALFAVAGLLAIATALVAATDVGPAAAPDAATLKGILAASGASTELLVAPPRLGSPAEQLYVHISSVAPFVGLMWVIAAISAFGAVGPPPEPVAGAWNPGRVLGHARDAAFLGALLLWLAVALTMLTQLALTDREGGATLGAVVAVAALATATVTGWHAATSRGRERSFAAWLALPTLTLGVAALATLSGAFGAAPFTLIFGAP